MNPSLRFSYLSKNVLGVVPDSRKDSPAGMYECPAVLVSELHLWNSIVIDIPPIGVRDRHWVRPIDVVVDVVLPELRIFFRDAPPLSWLALVNQDSLVDRAGLFFAGGRRQYLDCLLRGGDLFQGQGDS